MNTKSGIEIVGMYQEYDAKIRELESAIEQLQHHSYTRGIIESQLVRLKDERLTLETTRFQALEPVSIPTSALGGYEYYKS